jgi:hypothetical protein
VVHTTQFYVATNKIVFIWAILCLVSYSAAIEMKKERNGFPPPFYPDIETSFHSTVSDSTRVVKCKFYIYILLTDIELRILSRMIDSYCRCCISLQLFIRFVWKIIF